ncbi:holin [Bacillus sp. LL01]|uniref:hemolysin XhlA family protein n=1 Tax=Bacillus sp. LL01 TaxID=1665556 RepID=UPI00064D6A62|nr:hemolysin XhlA family protein [Bacillus sp. LL01]KMJ58072.1 holin [Bacillus sp. LL01]
MTEPSGHELNEKIADIREWLVRIDTKMDMMSDIKYRAERAEEKADFAEVKASKALSLAEQNRDDIVEMKVNTKWVWGVMLTGLGIIVAVVALFI